MAIALQDNDIEQNLKAPFSFRSEWRKNRFELQQWSCHHQKQGE
jgi:hypothetical protein